MYTYNSRGSAAPMWPRGSPSRSSKSKSVVRKQIKYWVAKPHWMPYLCSHFPQKNPIISGSFAIKLFCNK